MNRRTDHIRLIVEETLSKSLDESFLSGVGIGLGISPTQADVEKEVSTASKLLSKTTPGTPEHAFYTTRKQRALNDLGKFTKGRKSRAIGKAVGTVGGFLLSPVAGAVGAALKAYSGMGANVVSSAQQKALNPTQSITGIGTGVQDTDGFARRS